LLVGEQALQRLAAPLAVVDRPGLIAVLVDRQFALARLQAAASRCGRSLVLHGVDGGLAELFEFVGLGDIMRVCRCCGAGS
jgi:hypothetical protein